MRDAPMWTATLPAGPRGTIADVPGVTVGHCTLDAGNVQTGVTVVKPHPGDVPQQGAGWGGGDQRLRQECVASCRSTNSARSRRRSR